MKFIQRTLLFQVRNGFIDFLLQLFIVLVEAEGKVLDLGIRHIHHPESAFAIGGYEVIGRRFIQNACYSAAGFQFHNNIGRVIEVSCFHTLILGVVGSCGAHLHSNFLALVHVIYRVDVTVCLGDHCQLGFIEGSREKDLFCPFFRSRHAGSRHIHFLRLEGWDEAVEGNVSKLHIPAHFLCHRPDHVDFIACIILAVLCFEFKGHIGGIGSYLQHIFSRSGGSGLFFSAAACHHACRQQKSRCNQYTFFPQFHRNTSFLCNLYVLCK